MSEENWLNQLEVIIGDENSLEAYFLREAYKYAAENSLDRSTKNGAVIVDENNKIISYGMSGLLTCIEDEPERHERPAKYSYLSHAEAQSIQHAARDGIATNGLTMYCPWAACSEVCAPAIVDSGIKKLVVHKEIMEKSPAYWIEKIKPTFEIFQESGIEWVMFSGKIGGVKTLYNGQVWEP